MKKACFAPLLILCLTCQAASLSGQIVGVTDGDTVTLLDRDDNQHKIRLAGIDAPEKRQAFGQQSKKSLSDLVFDKQVTVETDKKDRYGRDVGKILLPTGRDVNLEQVTRGFAWHYKTYQREQSSNDRLLYDFAEKEARAARRGLWRDVEPEAPWDFRKKSKQ